jgi:hypothetical protein
VSRLLTAVSRGGSLAGEGESKNDRECQQEGVQGISGRSLHVAGRR